MTALRDSGPLWLIGCGNMGGALLHAWLAGGLPAGDVLVVDPAEARLPDGVRRVAAIPADATPPRLLVLAVKPQLLDMVAPAIAGVAGPDTVLVSILAGVDVQTLRARFPRVGGIARLMPNLAAAVGRSQTLLFADNDRAASAGTALAGAAGQVERLPDEGLFDAGTALSGCGPAFLLRFVDALAEAGVALGLPADMAARLALGTVEGTAAFAVASDESPAVLADRVASPGGATREGLNVLDREAGIAALLRDTLAAAARRSGELAAAARS